MSHGAIENLPPEPTTPSISSVSSELSFESDIVAMPTRLPKESEGGPKQHPTLFIRDDMVTILVEDMLFRIPSYFLTKPSSHLTDILNKKDKNGVVQLNNPDVSSSAFAHFLLVLQVLPPLDVLPVTTLAEWTDVLHLSFLWGVEHVRTAAIKAILPLASAVDKLVLGRAYEISDWIPGAYADVLERAEDLSVADIRRMNAEDIAAVARGRREARTERVRPRTDIEEIVRDLLLGASDKASPPSKDTAGSPPGNDQSLNIPSLDSPASIPGDAAQAPPHERDGLEGAKLKISRWLGQLSACLAAQSVPVECLVVYMRSDLARVPLVIDEILRRGLDDFIRTIDRKGRLFRAHDDWYLTYTNGWHSGSDGGRFGDLLALNTRDGSLGVVRSRQTKEACIRLVDNWNLLKRPDLKISMNELVSSDTWRRMLAATKYIAYLVDGPSSTNARSNSVVQPSVFASFWMALAKAYRSTKHEKMLPLVASTQSLLAEVGVHVSRVAVGTEMDEFYQVLEEVRKTEKERLWIVEGLEGTLDDLIQKRIWLLK